MALQMAQKSALWPSVMTKFGPCWRKVKLSWANIANVWMLAARKCIPIFMLYIVTSCMAQLKLDWLSYCLN